MTHRVNSAVLRIGKSLNWHSLGSPLYRWRELKLNLFLNYFLARFLEREGFRLVRYGVRSESLAFKIAIIAFRITDAYIGSPREDSKPIFQTYWRNHNVYKQNFDLGVFRYKLQGLEERIDTPYADVAGAIYINKLKKIFSIGPYRNWEKLSVFFTEGVGVTSIEPGDPTPITAIGFSPYFHIRMSAELMVLRYAVKKSLLRLISRRALPIAPKVFMRFRSCDISFPALENEFLTTVLKNTEWKNLLFFFLIFKIKGKKKLLKKHFKKINLVLKRFVRARARVKRLTFKRVLTTEKKFLRLKKKYFLFKKKYSRWCARIKRNMRSRKKKRMFRKGRYNLARFFRRLKKAKKLFRHLFVYGALRRSKNKFMRRFFNYKKKYFSKKKIIENQIKKNELLAEFFFKSLIKLLILFKSSRIKTSNFLLALVFKKKCSPLLGVVKKFKSSLNKPNKPLISFYKRRGKIKRVRILRLLPRHLKLLWRKLYSPFLRKIVGSSVLRRRKIKFRKIKRKRFTRLHKIKFFFRFFFSGMAILKAHRVRFKRTSVKQLYRKRKLVFFFEKRLTAFLRRRIELKFFNPLNFNSMDDLWVKSLFESLNFISNMYLRDRYDYKPAFLLSLYTMLAFKYNSPAFLGAYLANQLEWRWRKRTHMAFVRLLIYFFKGLRFNTMYTKNLLNFSVGFYGKVWGKLRAGKFIIRSSESKALPLRRISLKTDSSFTWAESQFGTFGVRIWIARN